jgi:hypothetical protein
MEAICLTHTSTEGFSVTIGSFFSFLTHFSKGLRLYHDTLTRRMSGQHVGYVRVSRLDQNSERQLDS